MRKGKIMVISVMDTVAHAFKKQVAVDFTYAGKARHVLVEDIIPGKNGLIVIGLQDNGEYRRFSVERIEDIVLSQ